MLKRKRLPNMAAMLEEKKGKISQEDNNRIKGMRMIN